mmetsp:Transcript_8705/g.12869  ORF Transcript_8705/g.12869 Transcript_8705/m.12869 type:complete len:601 (+) Transcript_8705:20-1822(+)
MVKELSNEWVKGLSMYYGIDNLKDLYAMVLRKLYSRFPNVEDEVTSMTRLDFAYSTIEPSTNSDASENIDMIELLNKSGKVFEQSLKLTVISATGIQPVTDDELPDPYVRIILGPCRYKTRIIEDELLPEWNDEYDFLLSQTENDQTIEFILHDDDSFNEDDSIGYVEYNIYEELSKYNNQEVLKTLSLGNGISLNVKFLLSLTDPNKAVTAYRPQKRVCSIDSLKVGSPFLLKNHELVVSKSEKQHIEEKSVSRTTTVSELVSRSPIILQFLLGPWSPICQLQLENMLSHYDRIKRFGVRVVYVTTDPILHLIPNNLKSHFISVLDPKAEFCSSLQGTFQLTNGLEQCFQYLGCTRKTLPYPMTFLIDSTCTIRYSFIHANIFKRAHPEQVLQEANKLLNFYRSFIPKAEEFMSKLPASKRVQYSRNVTVYQTQEMEKSMAEYEYKRRQAGEIPRLVMLLPSSDRESEDAFSSIVNRDTQDMFELEDGQNKVGTSYQSDPSADIVLPSSLPNHCIFFRHGLASVSIVPILPADTYVNGVKITSQTKLSHCDRIRIGEEYFRIEIPQLASHMPPIDRKEIEKWATYENAHEKEWCVVQYK